MSVNNMTHHSSAKQISSDYMICRVIIIFILSLTTAYAEEYECDTDLSLNEPTSKYIAAIKCLNLNLINRRKDIDNIQSQIDNLKTYVALASSDAANAMSAANDAASRAAAAESAANRAAEYAQETNNKLDQMFKRTLTR